MNVVMFKYLDATLGTSNDIINSNLRVSLTPVSLLEFTACMQMLLLLLFVADKKLAEKLNENEIENSLRQI